MLSKPLNGYLRLLGYSPNKNVFSFGYCETDIWIRNPLKMFLARAISHRSWHVTFQSRRRQITTVLPRKSDYFLSGFVSRIYQFRKRERDNHTKHSNLEDKPTVEL